MTSQYLLLRNGQVNKDKLKVIDQFHRVMPLCVIKMEELLTFPNFDHFSSILNISTHEAS
jgi:hypothetical protein